MLELLDSQPPSIAVFDEAIVLIHNLVPVKCNIFLCLNVMTCVEFGMLCSKMMVVQEFFMFYSALI